jgi:uncharacterized Zn finger protein
MQKRRTKKRVRKAKKPSLLDYLRKALGKCKKDELVDIILEFARSDKRVFRQLDSRLELEFSLETLIDSTRLAIEDATDFDEREMNQNFDYDMEAYDTVKRNFSRLIELGQLRRAMELSLELMRQGSCQIELSDEGMMLDDIEECLQVVIKAIKRSDLSKDEVKVWSAEMLQKDRVGFICTKRLQTLRRG